MSNDPNANPFSHFSVDQGPQNSPGPARPTSDPLKVPAIILLVLSGLMLFYGLINGVMGFVQGLPPVDANVPNREAIEVGQKIGFYSTLFLIPIINLLVLAGSISMLLRKSWGLAFAGSIAALIPICGPCFILGLPIGIWALVILSKPEVKKSFR